MHPVPVRLTPQQASWIERQTRCGSLTRSAAIRLCIQRAMESPLPLLAQASESEHRK
jgi:Arc/MetJ-type ribon-helix-helix transcriptional regulator